MSNGVKSDVNERPFGHAPGHSRHDRLLVVRFAAGDTTGVETVEGRKLVEQCTDCGALAADIKQIQTSLAVLPNAKRTRNFRLSPDEAERLRGSALDRFLRRLSMPNLGFVRPVAGVALALGLTITVVGAGLPAGYLATGAAAPELAPAATDLATDGAVRELSSQPEPPATNGYDSGGTTTVANSAAPNAAASPEPDRTETAMLVPSDRPKATEPAPVGAPIGDQPVPAADSSQPSSDVTRLLLIYAGVTLAMLAFAVLLLTVYARRRTEDPLLR